jgi:SAM-dependent methyltransferase
MSAPAAYDAYADWYEEFVQDSWTYMDRVRGLLSDLLGPGKGRCLDLCCGGGAHAATDLPDYAAVIREIARVLRPGGRLVHVGLHPCFVGAFADWSEPGRVVIDTRYAERDRTFVGPPEGVRVRVGAWHVPLANLLNAFVDAGLLIDRTAESTANGVADMFAVRAVRPA